MPRLPTVATVTSMMLGFCGLTNGLPSVSMIQICQRTDRTAIASALRLNARQTASSRWRLDRLRARSQPSRSATTMGESMPMVHEIAKRRKLLPSSINPHGNARSSPHAVGTVSIPATRDMATTTAHSMRSVSTHTVTTSLRSVGSTERSSADTPASTIA